MRNQDFEKNSNITKYNNLKEYLTRVAKKKMNLCLTDTMINIILDWFPLDRQINIKYVCLEDVVNITRGYYTKDGVLHRRFVIPIIGSIDVGYSQNNKILKKTETKEHILVLKVVEEIVGFRHGEYSKKYIDTLVLVGGISYED